MKGYTHQKQKEQPHNEGIHAPESRKNNDVTQKEQTL
jgi:hypothetical protein